MSDQSEGPGWWLASDGKRYPPPRPRFQSWPRPPRQTNDAWGCAQALVAVAALVGLLAVVGLFLVAFGDVDVTESDDDELDDVELVGCETDTVGARELVATLRVTNDSSDRSDYSIEVTFSSDATGDQIDTGIALVSNLQPGQSTTTTAEVFPGGPNTGGFDCEVVSVDRSASR